MDGGCQLQNDIKKTNITVGQVDFINCLPINVPFEDLKKDLNIETRNAVPAELNKMILNGDIDLAPVSSITYLENKDILTPFADLCIASNGPADSVLLFSHFPIEELDGANVLLSKTSATSNRLLQVIFKEFLKINVTFHSDPSIKSPAHLLIGDDALLAYAKMPRNIFIYDLGSLWKKHTGLPMIFGLWVARKDFLKNHPDEAETISQRLKEAKNIGLSTYLDKVVKIAREKILISKEFYTTYFEHLSYDFTGEYIKGLERFEELCNKNLLVKV